MAIVKAGLLGGFSGKIAGVVGGRWKNKQYARAYVVPANPNTAAQQAKRTRFRLCGLFGQTIVGNVLNIYMDQFLRGMSGYNWFMKTNLARFVAPVDYTSVIVTHGTLFAAQITMATFSANTVSVDFSTALGSNGLATDKVYLCVYDKSIGRMYFAADEVARSAGHIECFATDATAANLTAYLITARRDTTGAVTMVSDSASGGLA